VAGHPVAPPAPDLDSGAITGWSRGDARTRAVLRQALARHLEARLPVEGLG
jgi:hypothetical protein